MTNDAVIKPDYTVRFVPSNVVGVDGVTEVVVSPKQLRLRIADGWVTFELRAIPGNFTAELEFSRERYEDSYVRFLTDPPVTTYMPADGPTRSPDSHFWLVQEAIRAGGGTVHDNALGPRPQPDGFLDDKPILGAVLTVAALNWVACAIVWMLLKGDALRTLPSVDGFVLRAHGRLTPVSEGVWLFSLFYTAASLVLMPAAVAAVAVRYMKRWPTSQRVIAAVFVCAAGVWCLLILRGAATSLQDWRSLDRAAPPGAPVESPP